MIKKQGFSLVEIMIGMIIFTIGLMIIFIIPSNIVNESKEIDKKLSLYQIAINQAENLIALPKTSSRLDTGSLYKEQYFYNNSTYTGIYQIDNMNISVYRQTKVNGTIDNNDSATVTMSVKYASVTFLDQTGDYVVSFKIIPKN